ncbi:MAG: peptidase, imelysin family protein [Oleibacter sp.]|nr:peptidase, imelysin family protein [Thalassolituus sp.]
MHAHPNNNEKLVSDKEIPMKLTHLATAVFTATLLTACGGGGGGSSSSSDDTGSGSHQINVENVSKILQSNATIAYRAYADAVDAAQALKTALTALRTNPSQANLEAARKAWLVAREPYGQTEVYRFRATPVDSTTYPDDNEEGPEGAINAWPLGEALIDYVTVDTSAYGDFGDDQVGAFTTIDGIGEADAQSGTNEITAAYADANPSDNIIGDTSIEINTALLEDNSEAGDGHDVISGYHAIEFMLWGQDLNDSAAITNGTDRDEAVKTEAVKDSASPENAFASGGQRPVDDFIPGYTSVYDDTLASNRRHKFLEVVVDKLIADLTTVRDAWDPAGDGNFYDTFTTVADEADAKTKLAEILTGMGTLAQGELAGERMLIALLANSQEDEHSCFSDNTHRDIWLNAEGISNSYYGDYAGYDSTLDGLVGSGDETGRAYEGYGIDDYLNDAGLSDIKTEVEAALTETASRYQAIDAKARNGEPFDVLIMDSSNSEVQNTILALYSESEALEDLADALAITSDITQDDATGCDVSSLSCE